MARCIGQLPEPSLTALIDGRGNVAIVGESPQRPRGFGRTNKPTHCGACGKRGHTSRNRRCPARSA